MNTLKSTSTAEELCKVAEPAHEHAPRSDHEIADRTARAVIELQGAMDAALSAGLVVKPSFALIENSLAHCGTRIDSSVCSVRVYRKLT